MKLRDKLSCIELRQDTVKVVQRNRLQCYGHVLISDDDDLVKKHIALEIERARQRDRPRKTWKEVVDKDTNDLHLKPSDAVYHRKLRAMIRGNCSDCNSASAALNTFLTAAGSPRLTWIKGCYTSFLLFVDLHTFICQTVFPLINFQNWLFCITI